MTCLLGFDYGSRRIGVAVGNHITRTAQPVGILGNGPNGVDWMQCDTLFVEWKPAQVLVGLPLTMDGAEQQTSHAARVFAKQIEQRYHLPVELVDERLTSITASQHFADHRASGQVRRKHASKLDAIAACVIVESWLSAQSPSSTNFS